MFALVVCVCITLVVLAGLGVGALVFYVRIGASVLSRHGARELDALTDFVKAMPSPAFWLSAIKISLPSAPHYTDD
ncbi:hypothetical protein [Nocardia sp. NRRL WC-3656]|uniref:hypothetical protein n=1 Tax=Nocardia sp. NRRL WC-3656 TaxID=1463824 RepID=UPI0004C3577C|nr:hypothetical protein [Nocardia sp. NRRL WC-3656]